VLVDEPRFAQHIGGSIFQLEKWQLLKSFCWKTLVDLLVFFLLTFVRVEFNQLADKIRLISGEGKCRQKFSLFH